MWQNNSQKYFSMIILCLYFCINCGISRLIRPPLTKGIEGCGNFCLILAKISGGTHTTGPLSEFKYHNSGDQKEGDPDSGHQKSVENRLFCQIEAPDEYMSIGLHWYGLWHQIAYVSQQRYHCVHRPEDTSYETEHQLRAGAQY